MPHPLNENGLDPGGFVIVHIIYIGRMISSEERQVTFNGVVKYVEVHEIWNTDVHARRGEVVEGLHVGLTKCFAYGVATLGHDWEGKGIHENYPATASSRRREI